MPQAIQPTVPAPRARPASPGSSEAQPRLRPATVQPDRVEARPRSLVPESSGARDPQGTGHEQPIVSLSSVFPTQLENRAQRRDSKPSGTTAPASTSQRRPRPANGAVVSLAQVFPTRVEQRAVAHTGEAPTETAADAPGNPLAPFEGQTLQVTNGRLHTASGEGVEINSMVQWVIRQSYLETLCDLAFYGDKVRFYNAVKKAIRAELERANRIASDTFLPPDADDVELATPFEKTAIDTTYTGEHFEWPDFPEDPPREEEEESPAVNPFLAQLGAFFRDLAPQLLTFALERTPLAAIPGLPGQIVGMITGAAGGGLNAPAATATTVYTKKQLEAYIKEMEEKLGSTGDDAQLANVDLQNMLQKQQQTLQMLSNISKMLHDTALAVTRKYSL